MTCGPALISAYHDGSLSPAERRQVETHLRRCPACRTALQDYQTMRRSLGALPRYGAPPGMWGEIHAQIAARNLRPDRGTRWGPLTAAAAAVAVLMVAALTSGPLAQSTGTGDQANTRPVVAFALPQDQIVGVPPEAIIEIRFNAPVDRAAVQQSLNMSPPVPARLEWQSDKVLIVPAQRLDPDTTYTISVGAAPQNQEPIQFSLRTGQNSVVGGGAGNGSEAVPGATQTPTASLVMTLSAPTPSSPQQTPIAHTLSASGRNSGVSSAATCAIAPGLKFTQLAVALPDVVQTGCPRGVEQGSAVTEQSFEDGLMLWSPDVQRVYVLNAEAGTWDAFGEGPSGPTRSAAEDGLTPLVIMTPTAAIQRTPPPTDPTTSARRPGKATTPSPGLEGWRRFTHLWLQENTVRDTLGMPIEKDVTAAGALQEFERGLTIDDGRGTLYLLLEDRSWHALGAEADAVASGIAP